MAKIRIAVAIAASGRTAVVGPHACEPCRGQMESAVEELWQELEEPHHTFWIEANIPEASSASLAEIVAAR